MPRKSKKDPYCADEGRIYLYLIIGVLGTFIAYIFDNIISFNIVSIRFDILNTFFIYLTMLGELEIFAIIMILLSFYFYKTKQFIRLWGPVLLGGALSYVIKLLVNRPRPFEQLQIMNLVEATSRSFPSGHAILAFSILPIMNKTFPKYKYVFIILAVLIAFSRLYLGVHYLSDIIAGAALGYACGLFVNYMCDKNGWKF